MRGIDDGSGIDWLDGDLPEPELPRHAIYRCPDKRAVQLIVLSDRWVTVPTHYIGRRTMPCKKTACEGCAEGKQIRRKVYAYVMAAKTRETRVLECTDYCIAAWQGYHKIHGTMRGALLSMYRTPATKNGTVMISFTRSDEVEQNLNRAYDLKAWCARMWRLPYTPDTYGDQAEAELCDAAAIVASNLQKLADRVNPKSNGRKR